LGDGGRGKERDADLRERGKKWQHLEEESRVKSAGPGSRHHF
jgi:hypothetical protein